MACTRPEPTRSLDDLADAVVDGVHQLDPIGQAGGGQPALGDPQRLRIAVDADDAELRVRGQQGQGVAGHPERGVHQHDILAPERVAASMAGASSSSTRRTSTGTWPSGVCLPCGSAGTARSAEAAAGVDLSAVPRDCPHRRLFLCSAVALWFGCWAGRVRVRCGLVTGSGGCRPGADPDSWSPPASVLARGKSCQGRSVLARGKSCQGRCGCGPGGRSLAVPGLFGCTGVGRRRQLSSSPRSGAA